MPSSVQPHNKNRKGCTLVSGLSDDLLRIGEQKDKCGTTPGCQGFLDRMIDKLHEPVFILDPDGVLLQANRHFSEMFRIEPQVLMGRTLEELLVENPLNIEVASEKSAPHSKGGRRWELLISYEAGEMRELVMTTSPMTDSDGKLQAFLGTVDDVTETRNSKRLVEKLTYIDTITGLSNLRRFEERIEHSLLLPDIEKRGLAVVWLAIDRLNLLRDSHGEVAVEKLIVAAAEHLSATVRDRDLIAHVGGGRFALILFAEKDHKELTVAVDRIVRMVCRPVHIAERDIQINVRVGVSVFPQDGVLPAELIANAQTALDQTRITHGSKYRFYSKEMNHSALERLELEACLRKALLRKELLLHYQPQISIEDNRVVALEALLRWHSPENGWVAPDRFIPLAEACGMIHQIGNWVMKTALAQLRRWLDNGMHPLRMAINVSAAQLLHPSFVDVVGRSLQEHSVPPDLLEFELTESTIMKHTEEALKVFRALKKMGVHLAIDDFGTGYSSLAYLKSFPVDRLKIDQSFLRGLDKGSKDSAIIEAVIGMGHGLGLEIVAEGVEEEHQYEFLSGRRCDIGQGFLWSQPRPSECFPDCIDQLPLLSGSPLAPAAHL